RSSAQHQSSVPSFGGSPPDRPLSRHRTWVRLTCATAPWQPPIPATVGAVSESSKPAPRGGRSGGAPPAEPAPVPVLIHERRREARPVVKVRTLVAAGVRPLVYRVQELHLPRAAAIAIVYLVVLAALVIIVALLVQPVVSEAESLARHFPAYQKSAVHFITTVERHVGISNAQLTGQVEGALGQAGQDLVTIGGTIAGAVADLILVLVMSFLWLTTSDRLQAFVG